MTNAEARILTLIEAAEAMLSKADIACDVGDIRGVYPRRIHELALSLRRLQIDGFHYLGRETKSKAKTRKRKP